MSKTKKLIKFPSIEQFRNIVSNINRMSNYVGLDENGDAIYDQSLKKPILNFDGTIKLHGSNGAISYNSIDGLWVQSRANIITPEKDNAGFAFFVEGNLEVFKEMVLEISERESIDLTQNSITIYGEWCGGNIQKGVGISNLPKSFFIFGVKVSPFTQTDEEQKEKPAYWVEYDYLKSIDNRIYNIKDYPTYSIEIDFNNPQLKQNEIIEMTLAVEKECPVAKAFGFPNTIGEGIVFTCEYKGVQYRFKSKGKLHAGVSKVKTLKTVDDVKLQNILNTVDKVTPIWRLSQGLTETFNLQNGGEIDRKGLGNYIRWVLNDILKEESETISAANLEPKDINSKVSEIARKYFFEQEMK